jgi:thymidine phosphorylase
MSCVSVFVSVAPCLSLFVCCSADVALPTLQQAYTNAHFVVVVDSFGFLFFGILFQLLCCATSCSLLDVKYGTGAFQSTVQDAQALAESLVATGHANGLAPTTAFLTRMDAPLGVAVGNWLEVRECIDILRGTWDERNRDLVALIVVLAVEMLQQARQSSGRCRRHDEDDDGDGNDHNGDSSSDSDELYGQVIGLLKNGRALAKFREMVVGQGGDPACIDDPDGNCPLPVGRAVTVTHAAAADGGYVASIDALQVGLVSVLLGAGRQVAGQSVHAAAGIRFHVTVGSWVNAGDCLATLYCATTDRADFESVVETARQRLEGCFAYSSAPVVVPPIVSHYVDVGGIRDFTMPALDL